MRKLKWLALAGTVAFVLFGTVAAVKAVAFQGNGKANAPDLEKIEFIHWKKGYGKPEWAKALKAPSCYKFLTPTKIKWTVLPVNYVINPNNPQGLSKNFVEAVVSTSAETWDNATGKELMGGYTINDSATYGVQNYENAIVFGDYPTEGVIAVAIVWYNPVTRRIVEFDVMFNTDWVWGDATTIDSTKMDLQNIATHELGHGVGLADVYDTACSAVTMYGYSNYGETQKRTLEQPDIKGLLTLYP